MVSANGHPWLPILSTIIFVVIFAIAVRIMWREWGPEFEDQYGEARGRQFLALFLVSFPAFVVAHLVQRLLAVRRRSHRCGGEDT